LHPLFFFFTFCSSPRIPFFPLLSHWLVSLFSLRFLPSLPSSFFFIFPERLPHAPFLVSPVRSHLQMWFTPIGYLRLVIFPPHSFCVLVPHLSAPPLFEEACACFSLTFWFSVRRSRTIFFDVFLFFLGTPFSRWFPFSVIFRGRGVFFHRLFLASPLLPFFSLLPPPFQEPKKFCSLSAFLVPIFPSPLSIAFFPLSLSSPTHETLFVDFPVTPIPDLFSSLAEIILRLFFHTPRGIVVKFFFSFLPGSHRQLSRAFFF